MTTTTIDETWGRDAVREVRVGDVVDATGKALDLQRLIMRRWGWPKLSAKRASEWLEERYGAGDGYVFPVSGPDRSALQKKILEGVPGLIDDLMEGIANRAQREVRDSHRAVHAVEVSFVRDTQAGRVAAVLPDEGVTTSIASAVAGRLGISLDELRDRCDFHRDGGVVRMVVWVPDDD